MKAAFSITAASGAILIAGAMSASAALIDFTDDSVPLVTGQYTVTGSPLAPNRDESGPGPVALTNGDMLLGQNDGIGIKDDEISNPPPQSVTITFKTNVRLKSVYFLDLYKAELVDDAEVAYVGLGGSIDPLSIVGSVTGTETMPDSGPPTSDGLAELTGLNVIGSQFTFWVNPLANDERGRPDSALAAIDVAPVPLPASGLLLLGAAGGMAALRRRKSKTV